MRVFISCVSDEFRAYREALRKLLTSRHIDVKIQEDFADGGGTLLAKLDDYLCCCDALIHLIGDGTGSPAKPAEVRDLLQRHPDLLARLPELTPWLTPDACPFSYTQWEAFLALYHRRACYVYRASDASAREPGWAATPESLAAQAAHVDHLRALGKDRAIWDFADARDIAIRFLKGFLDEDLEVSGDPAPPTAADWAKLVAWQQTRVRTLDLGVGKDTVLLDLDVEIERTAGLRSSMRALGKRRHRGRRVQQAMLTLLADAPRLPLLLEGEPGAGKSVALARLAEEGLAECAREKNARADSAAPLPLLISLARLPTPPPGEAVSAQQIFDHVVRTGAGLEGAEAGTGAPALYARCLRWGLRHGRFRLLFDGFDEIPALLAAEDAGQTAQAYGRAIAAFAGDPDFGHCPTVVASRPYRSPDALNWPKLTLKELDDQRIRAAIDRRFKPKRCAERVFQELVERWEMLGALLRNPLFLDLICRYRASNDRPPETMAEAFGDFVRRRLADDADRLRGMGLTAADIERGAAEIALRMSADPDLGLRPDPGVLLASLRDGAWPLAALPERIVDVLTEVHLAAIERVDGRAQFSFKPHRRFHEYFATRAVLADPTRLSLDDLLWGEAWRDTAVTLLETAEPVAQRPLRAALREFTGAWAGACSLPAEWDGRPITALEPAELARALAGSGDADRLKGFAWPERALHLLGILNNASARGAADDPVVASNVDRVLIAAFLSGKRLLQKTAIELAHAGSRAGTLWLLKAAFGSNSAMLSDVALMQARYLRQLPPDLIPRIRESLVAQWVVGALDNKTTELTRKRLAWVDETGHLQRALTLLRWIRPVALMLCLLPLLWSSLFLATFDYTNFPISPITYAAASSLTVLLWALPLLLLTASDILTSRGRANACATVTSGRCVWRPYLAPRLLPNTSLAVFLGGFALAVALASSEMMSYAEKPSIFELGPDAMFYLFMPIAAIVLAWLIWDHTAPLAALTGRCLRVWQWPFTFFLPVIGLPKWLREMGNALWFNVSNNRFWLLFGIYLLALPGTNRLLQDAQKPTGTAPFDYGPASVPLALLAYSLFVPSMLAVGEWLFSRLGKKSIPLRRLLRSCSRTSLYDMHERLLMLRSVRRRRRLLASKTTNRQLADVIAAISRDSDSPIAHRWRKPEPDPAWDAEIQSWYRKYARRGRGVAYLGGPVLDELILLHADIQTALRYSHETKQTTN